MKGISLSRVRMHLSGRIFASSYGFAQAALAAAVAGIVFSAGMVFARDLNTFPESLEER